MNSNRNPQHRSLPIRQAGSAALLSASLALVATGLLLDVSAVVAVLTALGAAAFAVIATLFLAALR